MRHDAASEEELGGSPGDEGRRERRRAFFSSRGMVRPSPELLGRVERLVAEPRNDCLLLGPSGAGKTALLSSFSQAFAVPGSNEFALVPLEGLSALVGEAEAYRFGEGAWRPTVETATYSLQLRAGSQDFFLKVQDGPGSLLFPFSPARWDALPGTERHAYEAACLVLCIDATNPRPDLWRASLPPLLASLATISGSLIPRITSPSPAWGADFPRFLTPSRQLPYERVLVALTRIDDLVQEALHVFEVGHRHARGRVPPTLSPTELALQIEPLRLLEDSVGPILGLLRAALAPHAELAVGLTSAWGLSGSEGDWLPFGVREALLFLATGECREPVVRVDLNALAPGAEERWTEIPSPPQRR